MNVFNVITKILLFASIFVLYFTSNSFSVATLKEIINSKEIGPLACEHTLTTDLSGEDSYKEYLIFCSYQNPEYSYIIDTGSAVYIPHEELLVETIATLKNCLQYMDIREVAVDCGEVMVYKYVIYDFSTALYIYHKDENISLSKKSVIDLIDWLESISVSQIQTMEGYSSHLPFHLRR